MEQSRRGSAGRCARAGGGDEGVGDDPAFLARVDALDLSSLAAAPCATQGWPRTDPAPGQPRPSPPSGVPPPTASRTGPAPRRARLHPQSPPKRRVDALAAHLPAAAWRRDRILEGSKGPLVAACALVRASAVRDRLPVGEGWVARRRTVEGPAGGPERTYDLSNAPVDTPLDTRACG